MFGKLISNCKSFFDKVFNKPVHEEPTVIEEPYVEEFKPIRKRKTLKTKKIQKKNGRNG